MEGFSAFSPSVLKNLRQELETCMELETSESSSSWICTSRLTELFIERHGVSPEEVLRAQNYKGSLRDFLKGARRFAIYGTSSPQRFYVKPLQERESVPQGVPTSTICGTSCRGQQSLPVPVLKSKADFSSRIRSIDELESALIELIRNSIASGPNHSVTLSALSKDFSTFYGQPIRPLLREVCPGWKLIDLLQASPRLCISEMNGCWQITLVG